MSLLAEILDIIEKQERKSCAIPDTPAPLPLAVEPISKTDFLKSESADTYKGDMGQDCVELAVKKPEPAISKEWNELTYEEKGKWLNEAIRLSTKDEYGMLNGDDAGLWCGYWLNDSAACLYYREQGRGGICYDGKETASVGIMRRARLFYE